MATNPAATVKYRSYGERFRDKSTHPTEEELKGIMKLFATKLHPKRTDKQAASVAMRVFATAEVQHHAFLHLSVIGGKPTISVLHRPITVVKPLGTGGPDDQLILFGDQ